MSKPPSLAARASVVDALQADLVGPFDPAAPEEVLPLAPSRWYLTGFLAPERDRETRDPAFQSPASSCRYATVLTSDTTRSR